MATGADTDTKSYGFEWRTLLGPTHHWAVPAEELSTTAQRRAGMVRCELCGEPGGDGRPLTTNSAGQRPMHITCLDDQAPTSREGQPSPRIWEDLRSVVRGCVASLHAHQT